MLTSRDGGFFVREEDEKGFVFAFNDGTDDEVEESDVVITLERAGKRTLTTMMDSRIPNDDDDDENDYREYGNGDEDDNGSPIAESKICELEFQRAVWLLNYPVPVTRYVQKRSNDQHRRPAVILESIISSDYKRIRTESRFKRLTKRVREISIARWGFSIKKKKKSLTTNDRETRKSTGFDFVSAWRKKEKKSKKKKMEEKRMIVLTKRK